MKKTALVCGISGQDGAYLAELLLAEGYEVVGTTRDPRRASFEGLERLGVRGNVRIEAVDLGDRGQVGRVLDEVRPHEVYNLAGQSSVGRSFELPAETFESIAVVTLNVLEGARTANAPMRLFNAGSGECFGDTGGRAADERTPFRPLSPYAAAKAAAFWLAATYRAAYGAFACTGILFNHESPLRPERFVTRKIVAAACRIARGHDERLRLGDLSIARDWGWAPEYVRAMWLTLQQPSPDDYVIATGSTHTLREFVRLAFARVGLDWEDHVDVDPALFRPTESPTVRADPAKALAGLGWKAERHMEEVVRLMVHAEMEGVAAPQRHASRPPL